jgi:hypothetical protein
MIYQDTIYELSVIDSDSNDNLTKINDAIQDIIASESDLIHKKRKLADMLGANSSSGITKIQNIKKSIEDTK